MFKMSQKGKQVNEMFSNIARRYDFLNRVLSFGIDIRWRKSATSLISYSEGGIILDTASGTGDMALHIAAATPASVRVVGVDFCKEMIDIAGKKAGNSPYAKRVAFAVAPCEMMPFRENTFDSVTIAFGIRNLDNRYRGLTEMYRVLKPGGKIVILEFSIPRGRFIRHLYLFYFRWFLPLIGGLFSKFNAYKYLPDSVAQFPEPEEFEKIIASSGFINITHHDLTFGVTTVYTGSK